MALLKYTINLSKLSHSENIALKKLLSTIAFAGISFNSETVQFFIDEDFDISQIEIPNLQEHSLH